MKINRLTILFLLLITSFMTLEVSSKIINHISIKVGNNIITTVDIQNAIITNLIIKNIEINQENINNTKNYAVKNLIKNIIKRVEVDKYKIEDYNKQDLQNYIDKVAKQLNTDVQGLRVIFDNNSINYNLFVENYRTKLQWNTLIFTIYKNQTNVNIVDVENEVAKIKENKSNKEIEEIKKKILNIKTEEKLSLFSRSHLSNLESSTLIDFK
jgi:hypothetical protein|tara:strand:- start:165 stop:800 length:636 start_codon:yes stop_codon:yes gene_type:complete